jgi:DNA replication protein DnaC
MNMNIYQKIRNEYEKRRKKAFDELEDKKSELYRLIPRLQEIDDEINQAGFKYNKAILTGTLPSDNAAKKLSDTIESLKVEKIKLLNEHGYPSSYLSPVFQCEKCSDTGIIRSPDSDADAFCICYRQQLIDYLYEQSNLLTENNEGFESFITDYYPDIVDEKRYGIKKSPRKQMLGILDNCKNFVDNFRNSEVNNLLFTGHTGVGKTFMASCIAIELMKRGYTVLYQTAPALFNAIYEYRFNKADNDEWESAIYTNILESDLLIIDDLGTESPTGMRYSELLNIIDTRHANNTRKPCKTIICTNIDLKNLFEFYDERIMSRIIGGFDIFRFAGDDIRRLKIMAST